MSYFSVRKNILIQYTKKTPMEVGCMNASEYQKYEKRPASTTLKFILFVLIFALVTIAIQSVFKYFLGSRRGINESVSADGQVESAVPSRIVVLDAGHGGEDGGASSKSGSLEKDLNLSVTLLLADYLRASGVKVVLTRDSDRLLYDPNADYEGRKKVLDLRARLEIAENVAAEHPTEEVLFVSIHMNAYPSESINGLQVWYSPNASEESSALAKSIQNTAQELLQPDNRRKVKEAGSNIYLLDRLRIPSVLVECGFLSNEHEAALLSDASYQKKLAFTLFTAIINHSDSADAP